MEYYIEESAWERIFAFLLPRNDIRIESEKSVRRFIEGVCYTMRTGCQWRLLPACYGHWRGAHKRFLEWTRKGVRAGLLEILQAGRDEGSVSVDGTVIRAHACAAGYVKDGNEGNALGRSKGGFSTKVHIKVDKNGFPIKFMLTPGQRHDVVPAAELLEGSSPQAVLADKAYDSDELIAKIEAMGAVAVIPSRKNRKVPREIDPEAYKGRNVVERYIGKMKHFRRVFSRFDKTAEAFLGFLAFTGALIWCRKLKKDEAMVKG
jgi:transposase